MIIKWLARRKPEPPKQTTHCWCPNCRNDLVSGDSKVISNEGPVVIYLCGSCNKRSRWLFDAPCPIFLDITESSDDTKSN
jgi:RNase P subunit RPR2